MAGLRVQKQGRGRSAESLREPTHLPSISPSLPRVSVADAEAAHASLLGLRPLYRGSSSRLFGTHVGQLSSKCVSVCVCVLCYLNSRRTFFTDKHIQSHRSSQKGGGKGYKRESGCSQKTRLFWVSGQRRIKSVL